MKNLLIIFFISLTHNLFAQMCPGGGVNFSNAVAFDLAWIYGCNTGTSCNGGVNFDNRIACQPTTAMDACAPAPSCGNISQNTSNVWFKFYPSAANAVISCFQNTSLIIGVQAFSGGPACGSLTEMGCAKSGGPSSGVVLNLTGLIAGQLYYFRIFGSATPVPQRTGLYCFCGTSRILGNIILPIAITDFSGTVEEKNILLRWNTPSENNITSFDVEHSSDGISFNPISSIAAGGISAVSNKYSFTDPNALRGTNYYRLKQISNDGHYVYSPVIAVMAHFDMGFTLIAGIGSRDIQVSFTKKDILTIYSVTGQPLRRVLVWPGVTTISTATMANGVYLLHSREYNQVKRFCLIR